MISINLFCCCEKMLTHMNIADWEKFSETSLPEKDTFYSQIDMDEITDADFTYKKNFVNILK